MGHTTTEERRKRLFEIMGQIAKLEKEADSILEDKPMQSNLFQETVALPSASGDFKQTESIKALIVDHPQGIQKQQIIKAIKVKYGIELTSVQVQSALAYLKSKKEIQTAGYGRYKAV